MTWVDLEGYNLLVPQVSKVMHTLVYCYNVICVLFSKQIEC